MAAERPAPAQIALEGGLGLRAPRLEDFEALAQIYADPEVMRLMKGPRTREVSARFFGKAIEHWALHGFGMYCLIDRDGALLGRIGLQHLDGGPEIEIGYVLARAAWGRGLATLAGAALLRVGFEVLKLDRIVGVTLPENLASRRVLEKLGLGYVGLARYYELEQVKYLKERGPAR